MSVRHRRSATLLACLALLVVPWSGVTSPSLAAAGDIGYVGVSFAGVTNPPTSDKPESKLWWNDGRWWAVMYDAPSTDWHIFWLDRTQERWIDTGVPADDRPQSLADALSTGPTLYIASHWVTTSTDAAPKASVAKPARLYRYTYDASARTYRLDPGFPAQISNSSSESLVIDKDTTGTLWTTWTQVSGSAGTGYLGTVYVSSSADGSSWTSPIVMPVAGAITAPDDIASLVADGRGRVGVLWSNQADDTLRWAIHRDGDPVTSWQGQVAVRGSKAPDDHMNLKTLQSDDQGRFFAVVKTSYDELGTKTAPQIVLMVFRPGTGSWTSSTVGTVGDCHTRPVLVLDAENKEAHVFMTAPSTASGCPYAGAPGTIYEKVAPYSDPVFPTGRGTPVIRDAASANMNNATVAKQPVTSASGIVVLAGNTVTQRYWHADLPVRGGTAPAPTASFTMSPASGTAPLTVSFTDTSAGSPTSWAWDFGDGHTSTSQNPTETFQDAGTYTVTLTAANVSGSGAPATRTVTVDAAPPPPSGVARATTSTATTASASTLTVATPAGTASGDVLLACVVLNGNRVSAAPAGWTQMANVASGSNPRLYAYARRADAAEPAGSTWTFGGAVAASIGVARYTGAALPASFSTASGTASTTASVPGLPAAADGSMAAGCVGINSGSTAIDITPRPGAAEAWDLGGKRQELADQAQGAGSTGTWSWTIGSAREWAGWLTVLRTAP